jgi:hypothetical protein
VAAGQQIVIESQQCLAVIRNVQDGSSSIGQRGYLHLSAATRNAYAIRYAEFLTQQRSFVVSVGRCWQAWRACEDVALAEQSVCGMSRTPAYEQWSAALEDRSALLLCFEAVGCARGYCDAADLGSGDAIDFGHSFAVLAAARWSRPSIQDAWRNWRAAQTIRPPRRRSADPGLDRVGAVSVHTDLPCRTGQCAQRSMNGCGPIGVRREFGSPCLVPTRFNSSARSPEVPTCMESPVGRAG